MSSSLQDFKSLIQYGNYLILDTETTGLYDGEICQIAIIESTGIVRMDTLVKTTRPIPADATRIHGITDAMVASAPTWADLTPEVQRILNGRDLIVFNAVYDRKMMHQSAEKAGLPKVEWKEISRWHCAMEAFAEVYGDYNSYRGNYRWQKLTTAATYYGLTVQNAHSALGDCLMTLGVCQAMVKS